MPDEVSNISYNPKESKIGMSLDSTASSIPQGMLSFAMNAVVENFDGNQVTYQNETGNVLCTNLPQGYILIGRHNILQKNIILVWLVTEDNKNSEIGIIDKSTCLYSKKINAPCLGFRIDKPILKSVDKVTNCSTEVYWTDGFNPRRFIDLENLPFLEIAGDSECENEITEEVDCNKLNVQPNFSIPQLDPIDVDGGGEMEAGSYQFAIQYANATSEAYTSFYSITNGVSIFDPNKITQDFNYKVGKSISVKISNLDTSGFYDYFNLAVIKTVNNITTPYLVGTYRITKPEQIVVYTGQQDGRINLSLSDIVEKYPAYETAQDLTSVQDVLIWDQLTTTARANYQSIASKINLKWQTWRIKKDKPYFDPLHTSDLRGYMRDEVYPYEIVFLLKNGYQTDGFHIPSRKSIASDLQEVLNDDVVTTLDNCEIQQSVPKWKVYNTGTVLGKSPEFVDDECYEGPYEYGDFSYWESLEKYPCTELIWGDLRDTPIRHHKFPDCLVTHIHDDNYVYPMGLRIDVEEVKKLIEDSTLTQKEKDQIQGFKIIRGNRANNKSVKAKGLLFNVGKYIRDGQTYFYPNYPLNDLDADPFITTESNYVEPQGDGIQEDFNCKNYKVLVGPLDTTMSYVKCGEDQVTVVNVFKNSIVQVCSSVEPFLANNGGNSTAGAFCNENSGNIDEIVVGKAQLTGFSTDDSKERYTFHSPDTHFYQPLLGNIVKLEAAQYGVAQSHFVQVKNHARYKFVSDEAVVASLALGTIIGFASGTYGVSNNVFNGTAAWTAFQTLLSIIDKLLPRKNFAYQQNVVGNYDKFENVPNDGNKQRALDIVSYIASGFVSMGDDFSINNYQRESSVYLRAIKPLLFVNEIPGVPDDNTRYTLSSANICDIPTTILDRNTSAYYGAIKQVALAQYGQIYAYETVDTGFQVNILGESAKYQSIFGGDIFINKFALKKKYPFFIDNRVNAPDDSDVFYNEIGNIGYPKYWFSTDIRKGSLTGLFGVKNTAFDCKDNKFFYDSGKIYLFSYGIPHFFCESEVNVDMRQAFNGKEGDFYPHVSSGLPDDWLQETNVSIQVDNTYFYNKSFSKQNNDTNLFAHLPDDYTTESCSTTLGFRAIYSEQQEDLINYRRNNWLIYRPASKFDFPQNFGKLVSLDGLENKAVLARFENKSLLYNTMLTINTSNPQAAYLGNSTLFTSAPPIDFAETDLGFVGCQHKFLLKTEYGHVSSDSDRGQMFLLQGSQAKELTNQNVNKFFSENLPFKIKEYFPDVNIDNNFTGCGLHGVYDSKYNRFILTKLDYIPLSKNIIHKDGKFYISEQSISLNDPKYFCNNSFTISYDFDNQSWISFHSYEPNFYVGDKNIFYSGVNSSPAFWKHNSIYNLFNNYYGKISPYIIEYPYSYKGNDEILQNVKDYSKILEYMDNEIFVQTDNIYFNKCIIWNPQQSSGILELAPKPKNNLKAYNEYPKYNQTSKEILFTKSDSYYQFNTFWSLNKTQKDPIWMKKCGVYKELNQDNHNYSKRSFNKAPIRGRELKIRMINDKYSKYKFISEFILAPTMKSYK